MDALIGGLLGGGVAGAIIGGLVTLLVQRRALDEASRHRFTELRRERYAAFLALVDGAILARARLHFETVQAFKAPTTPPAVAISSDLEPILLSLNEIALLGQAEGLGEAAEQMAAAVRQMALDRNDCVVLSKFPAADLKELAKKATDQFESQQAAYMTARDLFFHLARQDLGVD